MSMPPSMNPKLLAGDTLQREKGRAKRERVMEGDHTIASAAGAPSNISPREIWRDEISSCLLSYVYTSTRSENLSRSPKASLSSQAATMPGLMSLRTILKKWSLLGPQFSIAPVAIVSPPPGPAPKVVRTYSRDPNGGGAEP